MVEDDVVVGTRPRRFAATPDAKELWISAELSGEVWIVGRARHDVLGRISFLPPGMRRSDVTPVGLAITAKGDTAYVSLGHANHIAVVEVATRKVVGYVLVGTRPWSVTLSRDETRLYVANGLSDDITVVDVASRKAIASAPVGRTPYTVLVDD